MTLIPTIAFALASSRAPMSASKVILGGIPLPLLMFGRLVLAITFLLVGSPWFSFLGALNLVAFPFDCFSAVNLIRKQRRGLAVMAIVNLPLLPPYLLPSIGALILILVLIRGRTATSKGIVIGVAHRAATFTPIYLLDRHSDLRTARRDWVIRRYGPAPVRWDPMGEGNPHLLVAGASGMGKSIFMDYLIAKLLMRGYPVTVIDPLGQYAVFAKMLDDVVRSGNLELIKHTFYTTKPELARSRWQGVRIYSVVESGMNVFKPVAMEPSIQVAEDLSYAINVVERQSLGATQHEEMISGVTWVVRGLLRRETEATARMERPSLWALVERIEERGEELYRKKRYRAYEAIMNLASRLRLLARYLEPKDGALEPKQLEARPGGEERWGELVVVDLSGIQDDDVKAISMELLLRKLRRYISTRSLAPPDRFWFIVIDEAWVLMKHATEYRSVVNEMVREVRNRGVGLILLTQRLGDLSKDALANIGTKIYLKLGEEEDVSDIVEYTGCHLLREAVNQLSSHEGMILKRFAGLDKVADASMFSSSADILLFAKMARLYPDKAAWSEAERGLEQRRNDALKKLEKLGVEATICGSRGEEVKQSKNGMRELAIKKDLKRQKNRLGLTTSLDESIDLIYSVAASSFKVRGNVKILERLSKEELAILVSHTSLILKDRRTLPKESPITRWLQDLRLTISKSSIIFPNNVVLMIVGFINVNEKFKNIARLIAENSCPKCLRLLKVNGKCPMCGREVRQDRRR